MHWDQNDTRYRDSEYSNNLDNASSSIVFYLEMKVKVEVGVHDISSQFIPHKLSNKTRMKIFNWISLKQIILLPKHLLVHLSRLIFLMQFIDFK